MSSNHLQNLALPQPHQPPFLLSVFSDWVTGDSPLCIVYIIPKHSTLLAYGNLNGPLLLPSLDGLYYCWNKYLCSCHFVYSLRRVDPRRLRWRYKNVHKNPCWVLTHQFSKGSRSKHAKHIFSICDPSHTVLYNQWCWLIFYCSLLSPMIVQNVRQQKSS